MNDILDYRIEPSADPKRPGHALTLDYAPAVRKAAGKHGIALLTTVHVPASLTDLPANIRVSIPGDDALYLVLDGKPRLAEALERCIAANGPKKTPAAAPAPGYL